MKKLLEGKTPANKITENLTKEIKNLKNDGINPTLCVIEVGDDPASKIYLRVKRNLAKKVGINEVGLHFPADTSQAELLGKIKELNQDPNINGIMVQLPVPPQIDPRAIFETIAPEKDADGFSPLNLGRLWEGQSDIIPATVRSILTLIDYYGIEMAGKNTVIIGRSVIVGKPLAAVLLGRDATVTIAHSKTKDLATLTKNADVIISDVGKAHLVTENMVKDGAVIIDVGMNRENGKLMGDVDFDTVAPKADAITPVPGGVGPLTVASLMKQAVILTRKQHGR
ncbi:5,10-methylene-tetrahydrofolate dehydrogenase Methenyl tetrahydrofolate cyclohydrolase [Lactobacillus taiwanensis DSM 21401]|uniref:bifunctional methylenetetrahydrofolate dehydrogenase/methenyltetrahydrofolate cyclohydrolase n=1 Tax=Lactobacillus taiwanensis TaxID=508451 RepID=UPI0006EF3FCF|nr:bifunctional methylenetetrahydrofolate dehydrogenase/methenyltetrahydrofolate cyclohydrolase [Lactobacillus taiwanensis]KRM99069.1 5,10-methylene-tetrahydrofolate dehydrogenase Methenyl tetrahydrofolate cyclohydrolase [Lactobacillus taiwanensis DSM 21401]MCR1902811.1 bifunctional methylenetetrahydrofolate dehydrogenase/methenyltetrahydrofolate cyclohydrolase [Lactobacillus taiwanensis]MRM98813.1 bifunctional methylenetetrahydrofolate dehydrogenase/methenyltetrahydrofolate cyclohydrolase [Lact